MSFNLDEAKNIIEENGFNLFGTANLSKKDADDELEKENFTEEEFEKACEDLGLEYSGFLKIGDAMLQIENLYNKQIRVQKVSFEISPDGKVSTHAGGYEIINTIDELKDMVKRYRLAYQEMKAIEKILKLQGDF